MFTEYKIDPSWAVNETRRLAESLKANTGNADFKGHAVSVVLGRLAKDRLRYRDYGPYWWAVKDVLRRIGTDLGPSADPLISAEYVGEADSVTLVMADAFRMEYLMTQAKGTNRFVLDGDTGEWWTLYDPDMETQA
jgi:hypothetical protein